MRTSTPPPEKTLRRVLIRDQAERDAISSHLLRYRGERGDDWADIIDMLTMYPEARRHVVRTLRSLTPGTEMSGAVAVSSQCQ